MEESDPTERPSHLRRIPVKYLRHQKLKVGNRSFSVTAKQRRFFGGARALRQQTPEQTDSGAGNGLAFCTRRCRRFAHFAAAVNKPNRPYHKSARRYFDAFLFLLEARRSAFRRRAARFLMLSRPRLCPIV